MRFGGHETFALREGWLHKGLKLLSENPDAIASDGAQDYLGVGKNMVKSIRHWLIATGLAKRATREANASGLSLQLEPLGELIWRHDPYFLESGTWWILHVNLVRAPEHAYSWWWFFNFFNRERFERAVCIEGLRRYLSLNESRQPGTRTQQRDVACLLSTYARHYPPLRTDPEDGAECPFIELGLLDHFRESGTFRLNQSEPERLPPEVLTYALARHINAVRDPKQFAQIGVREAALQVGSPGRALRLDPERLHEAAVRAQAELDNELTVVTLAGDRTVTLRARDPLDWVERLYLRLTRQASRAA